MRGWCLAVFWCSLSLAGSASAQGSAVNEKTAIIAVLRQQEKSWNEGDLVGFTGAYQKGPDILFLGPDIHKGYSSVLENFRHYFPNRDAMGHLTFSAVDVQPLDKRFATSTAHFHLQRTAQGGGDLDGYFMVVFAKMSGGWKIVRDDSTNLPQAGPK